MATSGTIQQAIRTGYRLQIAWSITQNVANNTSSVTAKVQLVSTGSSYTINSSADKSGSLTINGTKYTFSFTASLSGNQTKTLYTKTVTVAHNADGTKTCSFSATAGINVTLSGTYYGNVTASGSGVFNTIPRATVPTVSASSVNMGSSITINMPRTSSSFDHTLTYKFGNATGTIGSDLGTSTAWTVPLSLASQIPSGTSGTCTITCKTYNGNSLIGTKTVTFKANVPSTVVPTISSVTVADTNSSYASKFGGLVQNKSKAKFTITAAGAYGSTITAYKTEIEGKSYTGASPTTAVLTGSGDVTATITVTDSRGRTAKTTKTVSRLAYTAPKISTLNGSRANADGTEHYEGTSANISMAFTIASVGSKNTNSYKLEYKLQTASTWTQLESGNGYSVNKKITTAGNFNIDSSYDIRLTVTDYFGSVTRTVELPTAFTLIDFNATGKGMAVGKVSEVSDELEIDLDTNFYRNVQMGGYKATNDENNIYFSSREDAENVHFAKLYGGNGSSVTTIGCWDSLNSVGIWRYLSGTKNMVIDSGVKFTRANGGDEFVSSKPVKHGSRSGKVHLSNGLLIQWGAEAITPSAANTPTAKAVTFETEYDSVPMVLTTAHTTVMGTSVTGCAAAEVTTKGFDAYITRSNTTNTTCGWVAIGIKL